MHQHNHENKCISPRHKRRGHVHATSKTRQRETTRTLAQSFQALHIVAKWQGDPYVQVCEAHSSDFSNILPVRLHSDWQQEVKLSEQWMHNFFFQHHLSIRQPYNGHEVSQSFFHHEQASVVTIFINMPAIICTSVHWPCLYVTHTTTTQNT